MMRKFRHEVAKGFVRCPKGGRSTSQKKNFSAILELVCLSSACKSSLWTNMVSMWRARKGHNGNYKGKGHKDILRNQAVRIGASGKSWET